ncbi:MAG: hypothetical protein ABSF83_07545 [Nitrososphaerales archaeon]
MTETPESVLIVTLPGTVEVNAVKKEVSKLSGVRSVDFYIFSQKLAVRYVRDAEDGSRMLAEIKRALAPYLE